MSVLMPKDDINVPKSTTNNIRDRSPRQKVHSKQQNRDCMHMVNEKNAANLQAIDPDEDSETENLSPLLNPKSKKSQMKLGKKLTQQQQPVPQQSQSPLHIDGIDEPIDDSDEERGNEVIISSIPNHK